MKRIIKQICVFIAVILCMGSITVFASSNDKVVDNAQLLTTAEKIKLAELLETLSGEIDADIVVVTVDSLNGKGVVAYADDYFDYNGYGQGNRRDGVLLLIAMHTRDYAVSTSGSCINSLKDKEIDIIEDNMIPYLSGGDYYEAFVSFANDCVRYSGEDASDESEINYWKYLLYSVIFGLIVGFITVSVMKSKMKSVRPCHSAANYMRDGSMNLTGHHDIFLYRNVIKTRKPEHNSSGSSSHRGSSGRSHGGSHGKF